MFKNRLSKIKKNIIKNINKFVKVNKSYKWHINLCGIK